MYFSEGERDIAVRIFVIVNEDVVLFGFPFGQSFYTTSDIVVLYEVLGLPSLS
jgi:hypothetical protein